MSATVLRGDQVVWSEGLGMADVEGGITATSETKFRVGSVSKLFTAAAGRDYIHHGGSSNGGSAFLLVYPREGLVVAMAANSFANWGEQQALRLASFFLE